MSETKSLLNLALFMGVGYAVYKVLTVSLANSDELPTSRNLFFGNDKQTLESKFIPTDLVNNLDSTGLAHIYKNGVIFQAIPEMIEKQ